jgi:opacity protein-like surface antigen
MRDKGEINMKVDLFKKILVGSRLFIFFSLCLVMTSNQCIAQEWSRKGKHEVFALGQSMDGATTTGIVAGLMPTLAFDDTIVGGLGYGFNFSDHINLNTDLLLGSTDITGRVSGVPLTGDTDLLALDFNLDINILKTRFTPLLTGGIGFMHFSGNWTSSIRQVNLTETDLSYTLGAGFRFDVSDHFLIKALYKAKWIKFDLTDDNLMMDGVSLSVGYLF